MKPAWEIVIVGAGPSGIAAAIQLKRMGHDVLLVERDRVGGLLWNANLVENYPGFHHGISGPQLIHLFEDQLADLSIKPAIAHIHNISNREDGFLLRSNQFDMYCTYVVISTGTRPIILPLNLNKNIRSRIHRDMKNLTNIHGKHILIVGGGEAALDQAINLSKTNQVTIINRQVEWNAFPRLASWVESIPQITCIHSSNVYNIAMQLEGENVSRPIFIVNALEKGIRQFEIKVDEILYAIGREPELGLCEELIINKRVFFCGDVQNGKSRQVAIAVGDGVKAAMEIHQMIMEK